MNDVHFSSKTNEWATPKAFFDQLDKEFNFTLDVAATTENAKCNRYFTQSDDGLTQSWDNETIWCNPPYGRQLGQWVKKASEARGGGRGDAYPSPYRYKILSRLYLQQSTDQIY